MYTGINSFIKVKVEIGKYALITACIDMLADAMAQSAWGKNDEFLLAILNAKKALREVREFF